MTIYFDKGRRYSEMRHHPWTVGGSEENFRYVDFKAHPELIEPSLEDFRPYSSRAAVKTFYALLRWINGPDSELETNDCAFRAPHPHNDAHSEKRLSCDGRVFVFFRTLRYNLSVEASNWLVTVFGDALRRHDIDFTPNLAVIGFTDQRALYDEIPHSSLAEVEGGQLMLSFWAYGDTDEEVFDNLNRLFLNVFEAAKAMSNHIRQHKALFEADTSTKFSERRKLSNRRVAPST